VAHFESMPDHSRMVDLLMRFPDKGAVLMNLAERFLRGSSELTDAEREILFAYGSAINGCDFCHSSHKYTAAEFGVDEAVWEALLVNIDEAPIDAKLRPILHYVHKLTTNPSRMTAEDVASVLAAGWSEDALFDAICICGFSNLMNRVVDAVGIEGTDVEHRESGHRLATLGYDGTMAKARERISPS
jgi:uncharacterized peroxidase-related enzyme